MSNINMQLLPQDHEVNEKRRKYEQCLLSFWGANLDEEALKAQHVACQQARAEYMEAMRARDLAKTSLQSGQAPALRVAVLTRVAARDSE